MKMNLQYFAETQNNPIEGNEPKGDNRTFTQEDVNRIVSKRLAEEKTKSEAELAKKAAELEEREFKLNSIEILRASGLPDELLSALNAKDEETLKDSIKAVKSYINRQYKVETSRTGTGFTGGNHDNRNGDSYIRQAMGLK